MKKFLVLPGSKWQYALVEKIKSMGHQVLVVSPEECPPCAEIADVFFRSDIFAVDAIEQFAKVAGADAIISDECDIAMPVIAELGKRLSLPAMSCADAALYTDKFLMREFCKEHGLKSPEYCLCHTEEDALRFFRDLGKPMIIKPLDSNASRGVFKIGNEAALHEHFQEAYSFSRVEKAVLAERFITGTEFTVDGIKTPSAHYTLAISEKRHYKHNPNIANELYFTHSNPNYDYDQLRAANDAFVMHSTLPFGFTHAEYKYEDGAFYLIEIGARGGGNMISSVITQHMSGYDTYDYLIQCSLGNIKESDFSIRPEYKSRAAVLKFFETPHGGGKVTAISGKDYLDSEPDIKEYRMYFKPGSVIQNAANDSTRIGFFIACSESVEQLEHVIAEVNKHVEIKVDTNL